MKPTAFATSSKCSVEVSKKFKKTPSRFQKTLPQIGSPEFLLLVRKVKDQLGSNRSFALLDLSQYITEIDGLSWHKSLVRESSSQIMNGEILSYFDGKLKIEEANSWQKSDIKYLQEWLQKLISTAIPEIKMANGFTNVRNFNNDGEGTSFDKWHLDGSGASVTLAVYGKGTEILGPMPKNMSIQKARSLNGNIWEQNCRGCDPYVVPRGVALIFFGEDGVSSGYLPVIHRTPLEISSRTLFVIRY